MMSLALKADVQVPPQLSVSVPSRRLAIASTGSVDLFMEELVKHRGQLRMLACALARRVDKADDLVQETLRRAIEARARFRLGSNMRAWLMRILRNHYYDVARRRPLERQSGIAIEDVAAREPDAPEWWSEISPTHLADAVKALSPKFRRTYAAYFEQGLSYLEIAGEQRISVKTVGVRLFRIRALLRKRLFPRYSKVEAAYEC
jgi:RNA polymerase sigma-70 factor (ECF subfamily)